jgi:hypothetical protein
MAWHPLPKKTGDPSNARRHPAGLDRREEQTLGTLPISLDLTLITGSLCLANEKRTMRKPEAKSGL